MSDADANNSKPDAAMCEGRRVMCHVDPCDVPPLHMKGASGRGHVRRGGEDAPRGRRHLRYGAALVDGGAEQ
jgi:hypothetical protein